MSPRMGITQDKIFKTAIEFVDEEGYSALTIATLSKRLNIRPPSLYNHVSGLHEIQAALAVKGLTMLCEEGKQVTEGLEKEDAVLAFARQYVHFVRQHPGLYEAAFSHMNEKEVSMAAESLADFVQSIMSRFGVKEEEMTHVVRGLRSLLHGFGDISNKKGFQRKEQLEESVSYAVRLYIAGIKQQEDLSH
ncbi:TetR family transcriptional regulator [Bacillus xiamenensis]|uniref:WHG domain-containing protein n=1 Tax=Bacillus xiamenensis TaxID=1178537 RepID=A0ABT4F1F0_9BACI|nr:TetR-like C-terminal domain-containing protein [Bacillus xiamenensis]MBG9913173.1 TetR family transcriptional regulator [Bacillus xiamenensis]MCY9575883.1 WHG domain-containing protein [Bacillus xiamenensis]